MTDITVRRATLDEKPLVRALAELYLYDFTEFTGEEVDDEGRFTYTGFDSYWTEPARVPYVARSMDTRPGSHWCISTSRCVMAAR